MKIDALSKPKLIVLSLRNNLLLIIFSIFTICLVLFSKQNLSAAKDGLMLWANNVIPSLFPFFIATELLNYTNIVSKLEKWLSPIMKPIFNVSGARSICIYYGNYKWVSNWCKNCYIL